MSVLKRLDAERVLRLQRLHPALRHTERVVAKIDLPAFLVQLVHGKIGDPAEAEGVLLGETEFLPEPCADEARKLRRLLFRAGGEEHGIAGLKAAREADRLRPVRFQIPRDRSLRTLLGIGDIA